MERTDAVQLSQEIVVAVLKGEMNPREVVDRTQPLDTFEVYDALYEMRQCAEDYKRMAEDIKRSLEATLPYVAGEAGRWNSLGNLQSSALRIEQLAAVFTVRVEHARKAVFAHLMATSDSRPSAGDIAAAAETIETFAGIDEGENTDYDELMALASRLRAVAKGE